MTYIICLDFRNGILFNKRRISSDREVFRDMESYVSGKLNISAYTAGLTEAYPFDTEITDEPYCGADYCFIENKYPEMVSHFKNGDRIVVYRWDKTYPSDTRLWFSPENEGFRKVCEYDFAGYSHEKIVKEIYVK